MPDALDPNAIAMSPADAARALSVSRMTIYNLLAAGKLKARKLGNRTLLDADDVRRYFASLPAYRVRS